MTAFVADEPWVELGKFRCSDADVEVAIRIVDDSGVIEQITTWQHDDRQRLGRHAGGAPEKFPPRALAVAMVLAALHGLPLLATVFTDVLFERISPAMRARLGVPEPSEADDEHARLARYHCVRHRFHTMLSPIDPSPLPKNARLDPDSFDAGVARNRAMHGLDDEELARRYDRLTWTINQLIETSLRFLPENVRGNWKGSAAVDATAVPAFSRPDKRAKGKGPRQQRQLLRSAADPDAGLYTRTDAPDGAKNDQRREPRLRESYWAFEATLVAAGNDDPPEDSAYPALVVGMAPLHRPGVAPGRNAVIALSSIHERGYPAVWLAGDRAYSNSVPEEFQLPVRALGYEPVFKYREDQLGLQDSDGGSIQVDGNWYCPMMPPALINASADHAADRIDDATYQTRIAARRPFRLRPKAQPDAEGHQRYKCPASTGSPTARCAAKPGSFNHTTRAAPQVDVTDELLAFPPPVCSQDTITIPPEAGAKFAQQLPYGSPEWEAVYSTLRNTVEGINGMLKDGAHGALGDARRRRIRGVAAQSFFVALIVMAMNIRSIESFMRQALPDATGTLRRPRTRRRTSRDRATWTPRVIPRGGAPPL